MKIEVWCSLSKVLLEYPCSFLHVLFIAIFHAITTELLSCNEGHMGHKAENTY